MMIKYFKNEDGHFVCPDCGAIKEKQNSMHYHMKKHLEELNHVCKICKKAFLQKQTLDQHIRARHPEINKEEKKYACPFDDCEFTAFAKGNCVIHIIRVHFQEEVKEIMITNEDNKTSTCDICSKEFNSLCSFYYHCKDCLTIDPSDTKVKKLKDMIE